MKKITIYQAITILITVLTISVNVLANALPINGQGTGEISDRFPIYFVPEGYVFSIWGVIYLGLAAFTVFQALPSQRDNELIRAITPAYWIGSLANTAWIFLWHYELFPLTLPAMLTILGSLIYIYIKVSKARAELQASQKWFIQYPFSIYLGWISVATIANISQVLFSLGWGGWGLSPVAWAVILIVIAMVLGLLMRMRENDIPYSLVLIWALVGIALKQSATPGVAYTAWITAGILGLGLLVTPFLVPGLHAKVRS